MSSSGNKRKELSTNKRSTRRRTATELRSPDNIACVSKVSSGDRCKGRANERTNGEPKLTNDYVSSKINDSITSELSTSDEEMSDDEHKEKQPPPKEVRKHSLAVSSITKEKKRKRRQDDTNQQRECQTQDRANGVVSDKRVRNDLREYIRKYWYQGVKFIDCDETAGDYLQHAIRTESVVIPTGWTREEFCDKYHGGIKAALSQVRHNSQLLAQKNYLGKISLIRSNIPPI